MPKDYVFHLSTQHLWGWIVRCLNQNYIFSPQKKYNNLQGFVAKRNPLRPFQQGVSCKWNGNTVIVVKSSKVLFDLSIISILSPSFFTTATFGRFDLQESTKRFEKIFRRWRSIRKRCTLGPAKYQNLKKKQEWGARWWFQRFFIFTPIWGRFPFWLIFFRWVETSN